MSRKGILENMKELVKSEEEDARHLFVVCGQPSTREGFMQAWFKEDPSWFAQWMALQASIKTMEALDKFYE